MELWKILVFTCLGIIIGYLIRSRYAFHHHPPYISKVVSTTYSNKKIWVER